MNRILLVGNGYDLAAGLKTSYENFLVYYFKKCILEAMKNFSRAYKTGKVFYKDSLIEISFGTGIIEQEFPQVREAIHDLDTFDQIQLCKYIFSTLISQQKAPSARHTQLRIKFTSPFFKKLLGQHHWKDIENFYFVELVSIFIRRENALKLKKVSLANNTLVSLKKLNADFQYIKEQLADYLKEVCSKLTTLNSGHPFDPISKINEPLEKEDHKLHFPELAFTHEIGKSLIVNFNYTTLLSNHLRFNVDERKNTTVLQIHGTIGKPKEIIFGYGDDTHPYYSKLELSGIDDFLVHLKSFQYPLRTDYLRLINFLADDPFEVQVLGHSLGLSDRVLLKSIFEHDNCRCIRLLHRGRPDEHERMSHRYMALARHFDNKEIMRNRIHTYRFHHILR